MSGIAGIFCLDGSEVDKNLLKKMTDTIAHRGSIGECFYFNKSIGLGCRLQSNIGISEESHQPLASQDNSLIIVYDGHIYNYREIRMELEKTGYPFRTNTDAEVVLYSYRHWGEDCLNRFNGMWAFAIWDRQRERLFCARDRFGLKPFYYYFNHKVFVFASEIKGILDYPWYRRQVNEETIYNYLLLGLFKNNGDTFFNDIKELRPSHFLILDTGLKLNIQRWWSLNVDCSLTNLTHAEMSQKVEHFRSILEDAVKIRINPEETMGVTLSGGLDSSTITALASKIMRGKISISDRLKTISTRYDDVTADEGSFVDLAVRGLGVKRIDVFSNGHDLWEELPKIIRHHDEPCSQGNLYGRWNMMKKAKELGIKVILEGDGADAFLAGHHRYYGTFFVELISKFAIRRLFSEVKKASSTIALRQLGLSGGQILVGILYSRFSQNLPLFLRNFRFRLSHRSTDRIIIPSFDKKFYKCGLDRINEQYIRPSQCLQKILHMDLVTLGHSLRYIERTSSAFSIETRSPFLDYRLVEYAFTLPVNLKIHNGWTKWILRESMCGILPEQIRLRKEKIGFPSPFRTWFLRHRENITKLFTTGNVLSSQYINTKVIDEKFDELISHEFSAREFWRYINLEVWLQVFFNR